MKSKRRQCLNSCVLYTLRIEFIIFPYVYKCFCMACSSKKQSVNLLVLISVHILSVCSLQLLFMCTVMCNLSVIKFLTVLLLLTKHLGSSSNTFNLCSRVPGLNLSWECGCPNWDNARVIHHVSLWLFLHILSCSLCIDHLTIKCFYVWATYCIIKISHK